MPYASNWMPATVLVSEDVTIRVPALSAQLLATIDAIHYSHLQTNEILRRHADRRATHSWPPHSLPDIASPLYAEAQGARTRAPVPRGSATQSRGLKDRSPSLSSTLEGRRKGEGMAHPTHTAKTTSIQ